jgi:hypothetical protein
MGNAWSGRYSLCYEKKTCVEDCHRVDAMGALRLIFDGAKELNIVYRAVWNGRARLCECVCPLCNKARRYLYSKPLRRDKYSPVDGYSGWGCRRCHNLTYKGTQQRHTRAERRAKGLEVTPAVIKVAGRVVACPYR